MHILFLGPHSPLLDWLRERHRVTHTTEPIEPHHCCGIDWLISYGYRHILRKPVLDQLPGRAINLHIALLPWNRGADPNLWSFVDGTPKGVTIHHIDTGIDTGDIVAQQEVALRTYTLASTYAELHHAMQALFTAHWPSLLGGTAARRKQHGAGTFHRARDRQAIALPRGWNTPTCMLPGSQPLVAGDPWCDIAHGMNLATGV